MIELSEQLAACEYYIKIHVSLRTTAVIARVAKQSLFAIDYHVAYAPRNDTNYLISQYMKDENNECKNENAKYAKNPEKAITGKSIHKLVYPPKLKLNI